MSVLSDSSFLLKNCDGIDTVPKSCLVGARYYQTGAVTATVDILRLNEALIQGSLKTIEEKLIRYSTALSS